jgi:Tol biopolymer transport system component
MDIFVIAADGSGDTNLSGSAENDQDPVWAPDGTAVAYTTFRAPPDVVAMVQSVRGTEPIGEALSGPLAHFVLWSPDGRQLLTSHSGEGFGEISISDRRFTQPPLTIVDSDFTIGWAAWQRLEP